MKREYFGQIGVVKKQKKEITLSKLEKILKVKPILEEGMYAISCCGGIVTGRLRLSPFEGTVEGGTEDGKKYTSYMFRITDLLASLDSTDDLDTICSIITKKLYSIEGVKLFAVFDVTATDVPADYKIIQKGQI